MGNPEEDEQPHKGAGGQRDPKEKTNSRPKRVAVRGIPRKTNSSPRRAVKGPSPKKVAILMTCLQLDLVHPVNRTQILSLSLSFQTIPMKPSVTNL
jgi:hypothetical protein